MSFSSILIANRGEIAIRIARAAASLGLRSVAVHSADDAGSLHVLRAEDAVALPGRGAAGYLDIDAIVAAAKAAGCDAVHPGYGFLSENAAFAEACAAAGLIFIGPTPDMLRLFGDKTAARELASACGVPVLGGSERSSDVASAQAFLAALGPGGAVMVKAVAGGGGRGMRVARNAAELDEAWTRSSSEARAAFGNGDLYVEELIAEARHIEVQILGDGRDVVHLGERECTLQRRHQKLVEVAPSPTLGEALRGRITEAAVTMARRVGYRSLGTFEFLVDAAHADRFVFIEANPRLQVEHTVTEAVTGIDLVQSQIRIAAGASLNELGLTQSQVPAPRGHAIQLRINMETMQADGGALPAGGQLSVYEPPGGVGIRVDGFGYSGYRTSAAFDSLLAKLIVHEPAPDYASAIRAARRALGEFRIEGVATNAAFLRALLAREDVLANRVTTRTIDVLAGALVAEAAQEKASVLAAAPGAAAAAPAVQGPPGTEPVNAPMAGLVVALDLAVGQQLRPGATVAVLEAMKMEHVIATPTGGIVRRVDAAKGEVVNPGQPIVHIEPREVDAEGATETVAVDLDAIRPDLAEVIARKRLTLDEARPEAVARRARTGGRTARANVMDLCDPGSFMEYGALAVAGQRSRRSMEELLRVSPADGVVTGWGTVNAELVGQERASTVVVAYDYSVLAGTQGTFGHGKQDRIFNIAAELHRPLVLFAEGGGGRPGETDKEHLKSASLDVPTFSALARLSGLIPLVGVVNGRCFAGNAALLGCCDVIIATKNSNIGMGGPAMIEGGGLGVFKPEEIGPSDVQWRNGVIDILVRDEAEAVSVAKRYLSYFQGTLKDWSAADQRVLRNTIPENRLRSYDVRTVIESLADTGSVLELRGGFGHGMVTALIRIEGRPMGLIANNPLHLGGAIDAEAADKAARFLQMCDAFDLPVVSLCDTPGFMVGPDVEATAQVRRVCRMFVGGVNLSVPFFTVVLRKGYGLGAQAMAAGCFHNPMFNVSWPTGEFGGMGLEGAVRLGYRNELAAIEDPDKREAEYRRRVDALYARGKAINMASLLEVDDVIDPADTRGWISRGLMTVAPALPRRGKKRPFVDTW
ncbi:MAG: carbamoyl-phosphate synthase large subunit [Phreatobacter sp.]|uniref:acetyl-CoA carboxylase family protein n=1 Tax=Phreatobacter sp. TaxID=1966341 RepID=UPI001A4A0192|nr:carboxyl transferase domain-containing protein [Phreatobacter sp.]MBL8569478.1 carbamoyl-phosphate synthase large subunit [Phreatobacter sp.]